MVNFILKRLPPDLAMTFILATTLAPLVVRFFLSTFWGLLLTSLLIWLLAPVLFGVEPMSARELVLHVDALPEGYKVGVVTSVLTVIGFLISFAVGIHNWHIQQRTQLQLEAAAELEEFVAQASLHVNTLTFAARRAIELRDSLRTPQRAPNVDFALKYWLQELPKTVQARTELSNMSVSIHRLTGKYTALFSGIWGAFPTFQRVVDAFTHLSEEIWKISLPSIPPDDPNAERWFLQWTSVEDYKTFLEQAELASTLISGQSGTLRGQLQARVTGISFGTLATMFTHRKQFKGYIEAMRKADAALKSKRP